MQRAHIGLSWPQASLAFLQGSQAARLGFIARAEHKTMQIVTRGEAQGIRRIGRRRVQRVQIASQRIFVRCRTYWNGPATRRTLLFRALLRSEVEYSVYTITTQPLAKFHLLFNSIILAMRWTIPLSRNCLGQVSLPKNFFSFSLLQAVRIAKTDQNWKQIGSLLLRE